MFVPVQKVDDQADNQPDAKSYPVGNSQFTHHVKTTGKAKYRNKRKIFCNGVIDNYHTNNQKDPHRDLVFK